MTTQLQTHSQPYRSNHVDKMIDQELSQQYRVNCIGCGKRLETWLKCPVCQRIYFCECGDMSRCACFDIRVSILSVIEDMTQLLLGG